MPYTSTGQKVSEATIKSKYSKSLKEKYQGIVFTTKCEGCNKRQSVHNDHTIAKARCKVLHKTELIWDKGNYVRSCEKCHHEWEDVKGLKWMEHKNVDERLRFLKANDPQGYEYRMAMVEYKQTQL